MDYVVNKTEQVGVEANSPKEAVSNVLAGHGITISVNYSAIPRPQPPPQSQVGVSGVAAAPVRPTPSTSR